MQIEVNEAYLPLLDNRSRYLVLFGGGGSGKSVFAVQKLLLRIISEPKHRILICRKFAVTLRESVVQEIAKHIASLGISNEFEYNKTEKTFTHTLTGNQLMCVGLDDPEKIKSISGISSIWVEEATELSQNDLDQLDLRLRDISASYQQIILTFNPTDERHWLKERFFDSEPANTTILKTTFRDNIFLPDSYKDVLEAKALTNPNYYRIYFKGEWGREEVQSPYVANFDRKQHVGKVEMLDKPIYFSIDFNVEPMACVCYHDWTDAKGIPHHRFFKEIVLSPGDTLKLAETLKQTFTPKQLATALYTGDATGRKRDVNQRDNVSSWRILQKALNISTSRLKVPKSNASVKGQRDLINLYFSLHPDLKFDDKMTTTINELEFTECDSEGNILKKDRSKLEQRADFLDVIRYSIMTFHSDFEKHIHRFLKMRGQG